MGNTIFSSQFYSNDGELYKIDLFAESYRGINTAIIGGTGNTYYVSGDWTDFLVFAQTLEFLIATPSSTGVIVSFSYNSANDRTEILTSIAYSASYITLQSETHYPEFDARILSVKTSWENEGDILLQAIKASSTIISYANEYAWFDRFMDMYMEATDDDLKLVIYKDNSGWELDWVGNIVIDLVEWDNSPKPFAFTIKAIDGLDKLKDIPYSEVAITPTETAIKTHIYNLLSKNNLAQFWGVSDDYLTESIEYKSNEVSGTLTTAHSPLDYCYISDRMFINKDDNDDREGMSCYEALRGILELFNTRMFLSKGKYYIQQVRNFEVPNVIYARTYGRSMTSYAATSYDCTIATVAPSTIGSTSLKVLGGGKFSYLAGLYDVRMDVNSNKETTYKMETITTRTSNNPVSTTEVFKVYGGVGSGSTITMVVNVYANNLYSAIATDYARIRVEMYGTEGGVTYYLVGNKGTGVSWKTVPYSGIFEYTEAFSGMKSKQTVQTVITTPEVPFSGDITIKVTLAHYDFNGVLRTLSFNTFSATPMITIPIEGGLGTDTIAIQNIYANYTKSLELPPLVITDFSNATSINVISVKEDYLTTNTTLVETVTWDADFDTDDTLTATRVMEAMSLQYRPISRYLGGFTGQYYPHQAIQYNNKTYFFNGFTKDYSMDEVEGEWVEETNSRAGIGSPIDYGGVGGGEVYGGDGNNGGMVALNNNQHTVSATDGAMSAGTITSIPISVTGMNRTILAGDTINIVEPITNQVLATFVAAADVASGDTTISVNSTTIIDDIEEGMAVQLSKESVFDKLNKEMAITDYMLEVAQGNIVGQIGVNVNGANADVASGTQEDITDLGGTYTYPTSNTIRAVKQSVDQPTLASAPIEIVGLDINWDLVTQTVNLSAGDTTNLITLGTYLRRVLSARILSDVVATSDVVVTSSSGLVDSAKILAGAQKTAMCQYTIPAGYTGYITKFNLDYLKTSSKNPDGIDFAIWTADRLNDYAFTEIKSIGLANGAGPYEHIFMPYLKIEEQTDIKITATPSGGAAHVHAGFDLILVENA